MKDKINKKKFKYKLKTKCENKKIKLNIKMLGFNDISNQEIQNIIRNIIDIMGKEEKNKK